MMTTSELIEGTARVQEMIGMAESPLAFFYADEAPEGEMPKIKGWSCVVADLNRARRGATLVLDVEHIGCDGGKHYLGFCPPREGIAEFVSSGIPGEMEGEHYKKSPDLVEYMIETSPPLQAEGQYAIFKPVSELQEGEEPRVVICFGNGDILGGLAFLSGFDRKDDSIIAPFCSGCGSIVTHPLREAQRELPRAVIGMFDPSARPYVRPDELSFAVPRAMWEDMVRNAPESFLKTPTWAKIKQRIRGR